MTKDHESLFSLGLIKLTNLVYVSIIFVMKNSVLTITGGCMWTVWKIPDIN